MAKIGAPLFIVREDCKNDLTAVLEKLAGIGYEGIEFLGFFGHKPEDIKRQMDSLGLKAVGDHVPYDEFESNTDKVLSGHAALGCEYITVASPGPDGLSGGGNYSRTLETIERLGKAAKAAGITLLFHNHADELRKEVKGKTVLENLLDDTNPDLLQFEPDLGWMRIGGTDPGYYLRKYKNRCPVVHFKDYTPSDNEDGFVFRPTGYGTMNNVELFNLCLSHETRPEWYIMDHDCAYGRDAYWDMKISLEYFKNLLALV